MRRARDDAERGGDLVRLMGSLAISPWQRRTSRLVLLAGAACALAACGSTVSSVGKLNSDADVSASAPVGKVDAQPLPGSSLATPLGDTLGTGAVKVALVLPLTSPNGQPSVVGQSLRNAADMALSESGSTDLTLLIKDDHSNPDGARAAAQLALSDGAELFVGPLFAPDVREVGKVARGAGKPMIAFSTDTSTAARGSYLLSFLIESYVDRIVDYAAAKGKKSAAALIPDTDYGRVADAEFQQEAAKKNIRVQAIEHYTPQTLAAAVKKIAALGDGIDSLFIPEQSDAMPAMAEALAAGGIDRKRVQLLSTQVWDDPRLYNLPALQGAWYAAPDGDGFAQFSKRYRAKYNADPTRIATLSFDAVQLAAALVRTQGTQRFSDGVLLNKLGFKGTDGVFRFRADGLNERGLAVMQINGGAATPVSPAPKTLTSPSAT